MATLSGQTGETRRHPARASSVFAGRPRWHKAFVRAALALLVVGAALVAFLGAAGRGEGDETGLIKLTDGETSRILTLRLDKAGGRIWLSGDEAEGRIMIRLADESACFGADLGHNQPAAVVGISDGRPTLCLGGKGQHGLVMDADREAVAVRLYDADNKMRATLGLQDSEPALVLYDRDGNARAALFLKNDGTPQMEFFDAKGDVVWQAQPPSSPTE